MTMMGARVQLVLLFGLLGRLWGQKLEVNMTALACQALAGSEIRCPFQGDIVATDGNVTEFEAAAVCDLPSGLTPIDLSVAENCTCTVEIRDPTGQLRTCGCSLCEEGFGSNPISIDCGKEMLVDECSSVDCDSNCNGSCIESCSAFSACSLCVGPTPTTPATEPPPATNPNVTELLPECVYSSTFNDIVNCLREYSDPACLDQNTSDTLQACLIGNWSVAANETIPPEHIEQSAACFEDVSDCINDKAATGFSKLQPCSLETGLALAQCFIDNSGACAASCTSLNWTSPFGMLDDSAVNNCSSAQNSLMDPMCELVSCCTPCVDELEGLASCLGVQALPNKSCDLTCNMIADTRQLEGASDIVITAAAEVAFSRCTTDDLGTVATPLAVWFGFADCVIDEILDLFEELSDGSPVSTPTIGPTAAPVTSTPITSAPVTPAPTTRAPTTLSPTQSPTRTPLQYNYKSLVLRLEGATKEFTENSRAAFETTTEEFFKTRFLAANARRRLQEGQFVVFDTDVTSTSEQFDTRGNTVIYDQSVTFVNSLGTLTENQMQDLLASELSNNQEVYLDLLRQSNADFETVSAVNPNPGPRNDDDDDDVIFGLSLAALIIIIAAILVLPCCCYYAYLQYQKRRSRGVDLEEDYDKDHNTDYVPPTGGLQDMDNMETFGDEAAGDGFQRQDDNNAFADEFGSSVPFGGENEEFGDERSGSQSGGASGSTGSGSGSGSDFDDEDESGSESSGDDESGDGSSGSGSEGRFT